MGRSEMPQDKFPITDAGEWWPDSSLSDPGQRAASGREAGLRVLRGGEEGRVAHARWESGKGLFYK